MVNEDRASIIQAYINDHNAREISNILRFKRTSILAIIKKYNNNESTERKLKKGNRKKSLNEEDKIRIINWVYNTCGISLKQLKLKCEIKIEKIVGQITIKIL
ncbi:hypothetical protein CDIK_0333 [Cucumispora dikerogammari]|nr:hypothetical protein CDIK_0333 [Cucumispora dikerogammari]